MPLKLKVFLVDDSVEVVQRLRKMIAPLPGVVLIGHASDIPDALKAIRAGSPDVVVLDLHLPSGSGIKVLQAITKEKPGTYVIVHTNYAFPQYQKKCMEGGAYAFLDKSRDFDKVPKVIQELWSRSRSRGTPSVASDLNSASMPGRRSRLQVSAKSESRLKPAIAPPDKEGRT